MLKSYAALFTRFTTSLESVMVVCMQQWKEHGKQPLWEKIYQQLHALLDELIPVAEEFELDAVVAQAKRIKNYGPKHGPHAFAEDCANLKTRLCDQLASRLFLHVPPGRAKYYTDKHSFGNDVSTGFSSAMDDIEDAGKCLALGQGTACVMHLMRVMEVGLKALGKSLKIPYAPTWDSYLRQIQAKISAKHRTKGIKWKRDEKFYQDVSGDLVSVKQAWRNPTMHIGRRYSPEEAEEIFVAVRTFMRKLAAKLDQNGQDVTWLSIE